MRLVSKVSISLGLETPRLGIAWFLVSLPLAWERQGREQNNYQLKFSPASIRLGRGQKEGHLPCLVRQG